MKGKRWYNRIAPLNRLSILHKKNKNYEASILADAQCQYYSIFDFLVENYTSTEEFILSINLDRKYKNLNEIVFRNEIIDFFQESWLINFHKEYSRIKNDSTLKSQFLKEKMKERSLTKYVNHLTKYLDANY